MEKLEFKTQINAPVEKVWNTMLQPESYKAWVADAWPGSYYTGTWDEGTEMRFLAPEGGGTLALILENKHYESIKARHIAMILADGSEDRDSELAKEWNGTMESYDFTERDGKTELLVTIETTQSWDEMFSNDWPKALAKLKEICER